MVRCYDCGQLIPEEQIVRRVVWTEASRGILSALWSDLRFVHSRLFADSERTRSYRHNCREVNLCPACSATRTRNSRLGCLILVLTIYACGTLFLMNTQTEPKTTQQVKQNELIPLRKPPVEERKPSPTKPLTKEPFGVVCMIQDALQEKSVDRLLGISPDFQVCAVGFYPNQTDLTCPHFMVQAL